MREKKAFRKNKYWLIFGIALLLMLFMPQAVMAAAPSMDGSITFSYKLADVEFRLFLVGEEDAAGNLVYTEEFKEYPVDPKDANAAQTLENFVIRDSIQPLLSAKTDANRKVVFDGLATNRTLYLICGDEKIEGNSKYIPSPTLVYLPTESEGVIYKDINVVDKCEIEKVARKNLSLLILWRDFGLESIRPTEITIQLLKDGVVEDEVTLGPENNWSYEWKDLDPNYTWTVVEKVNPPEYGFSIRKEGDTYIIVHDRAPEPNTPPADTEPDTPVTPSSTVPGQLPQTGQLWWPVFALICAGLLSMIIGLVFKRMERE